MDKDEKYNSIGSEAVQAKTGKGWKEWIAILDKEKADKLPHKEIVEVLWKKHKLSPWWAQMVTVGYEQAKGLRAKNQSNNGEFRVDISKVITMPLAKLYAMVADNIERSKWLRKKVEIRKANKDKSIRANFNDGTANLTVMFYQKGERSQIVITESKLTSEKQVEERRGFWKNAVERLEKTVCDVN